ncbi:MAG: hypothetical protein GX421_03495 [Caldisericales bacterium]|nr:hypothetical protein [Caldisericales bacterium]
MGNFEAWVSRESEKLGTNFASLDLEVRNRLLEELMSGLENGFRSRMDSPDLRFAMRKGIGKKYTTFSHYDQSDGCAYPMSGDSTCPPPPPPDACDAPCQPIDLDCPGDSNGCNTGDGNPGSVDCGCGENFGYVCDNGCVHTTSAGCIDEGKCKDGGCENNGGTGEKCIDGTLGGFSCVDEGCFNTASAGCTDSGCEDNEKCLNNSQTANCTDQQGCKDNNCDNRNVYGNTCVDMKNGGSQCRDDMCCNRKCLDNESCFDDVCANGRDCIDDGCYDESSSCGDSACFNSSKPSSSQIGCLDHSCKDAPCMNYGNTCKDESNQCQDDKCANWATCQNTASNCDDSNVSDTGVCINRPYCPPTGGQDGCRQDWGSSSDDASPCVDSGGNCIYFNCTNSNKLCWDTVSVCTDNGCTNTTLCMDSGSTPDNACVDQCQNNNGSNCIDFENCNDDACANSQGMCLNDDLCKDTNNCSDGRCFDVGQSTLTHCTDSTACGNTKCVNVRERDSENDISQGCPVCDTNVASCPYCDHSTESCVDHRCDP